MKIHFRWCVLAFVLSRIAIRIVGIEFDTAPVLWFWQIIDPHLLKNHLATSLLYLHNQPPLFNFLLGVFFKLGSIQMAPYIFYLAIGILFLWILFKTMTMLGVNELLAAILAALFSLSPACILYENWLFYTYPIAFILVFSVFCLQHWVSSQRLMPGFLFFLMLALCILTRTSFHFVWFLFILLLVLRFQILDQKQIVRASAFPILLLLALYSKDFYLFGGYPGGTTLGMSLFKVISWGVSAQERQQIAAEGKMSAVSLVPPYSWLTSYPGSFRMIPETGIPLLDQKVKTTGFNNYNHKAYIGISRSYLGDAFYLIKRFPQNYMRSVCESFRIYTLSATQNIFLRKNREKFLAYDSLVNLVILGNFSQRPDGPYWLLILGLPTLFLYSVIKIVQLFRQKKIAIGITVLYLSFNILYASIVGNILEVGENNRFRFEIDSYFVILFGLALTDVLKHYSPSTMMLSIRRALKTHEY